MLTITTLFSALGVGCSVIPKSALDLTRGKGRFQVRFHQAIAGEEQENTVASRWPYYVYVNRTKMCCYVPKQYRSQSFVDLPNATEVAAMSQALSEFIGNQCVRTRNSWWFFELCWGKYLGQYHYKDETSAVKETEIYLFRSKDPEGPATFNNPESSEPYLSYLYGDGSWCPETNKNRTTEIKVYCNRPDGGRAIPHLQYDIVQSMSCHHVVSFYTEALCQFKWFHPKTSTEFIDCYPTEATNRLTDDALNELSIDTKA